MKLYDLKFAEPHNSLEDSQSVRLSPGFAVNMRSCCKEGFDILQRDKHAASG
jgi:hypothetical protein